MNTIDFNDFYRYFQDIIIDKKQELYQSGLIQNDLSFVFFKDTGKYFTEMETMQYEEGAEIDKRVLVNIMNGGGVQDSTIAIDTYAQIVSFECLALEEYRSDIEELFIDFVSSYKAYITSLSNATIQIQSDDFPKVSEMFDAHGYEKFTINFTFTVIVMPNAKISNKMGLTIDGTAVKFNNIIMNRTTEMTPELKKAKETKFFPNSTSFVMKVSGLFVDNTAVRELLTDCTSNNKFNTYYTVTVTDNHSSTAQTLVTDSFFAKDITFTIAFGTIISWEATFYKGRIQ